MKTLEAIKQAMIAQEPHWYVPFMDFVDDFRRNPNSISLDSPLTLNHARYDALLASTLECLCDEQGIEPPAWSWAIPSLKEPWFVSGIENLKAIAIVESPGYFRRRNLFVLENFLSRV